MYHQCDQFCIMFIYIYVKSYYKVNKLFWKHEFHDVLAGNQIFKKYFYVYELSQFEMGIAFKQKGVRKYWTLTTMEHMETKEIHNYVIDLNNW
jgi:hypothetical protein